MQDLLSRTLRRGRIEDRALTRDNVPDTMLGAPTVAGPVGERAALRLADVYACVSVIANAASTLPLIAYRRVSEGRERLDSGRLADLLRAPAPALTQAALIGHLVASLATRGNAYLGLYAGEAGQVEQLGVIAAERVQVQVIGGKPLYTLTHADGRQTTHDEADIVHVRLPLTVDGVIGLSPLAQCREALGLNRALTEEASALATNSSAPKGVLTVPAGPTQEDLIENLRKQWNDRHQGPTQAGRIAVLSGEISFAAVSLSPHDAEFVEQRRLSTQEIARIFLPPCPWLINAPSQDSLTYATTESQNAAFARLVLSTYLVAIEQAISNSRLCPGPNVHVEFNLDAFLRPDAKTRSEIYTAALGNPLTGQPGWLSRADVRAMEGLPPETQQVAA